MEKVYGFLENKCRREVISRTDIIVEEGELEIFRDSYGNATIQYPKEMGKDNTIILSEMYKVGQDTPNWSLNEPSVDNQGLPNGRNVIRTTLRENEITMSILNCFGTTEKISYRIAMMKA